MTSALLVEASVSRILGLLEAVQDASGEEDVARLAMDFDEELDEIQKTLDAVEALGLAIVDDGNIRLTPHGKALLSSKIRKRKELFRERMLALPLFQELRRALQARAEPRMSREEVLGFISDKVPGASAEEILRTIINWGRYAEIVNYDTEGEEIRLAPAGRGGLG